MQEHKYCKRLIEVDLPIKRISDHARREKSIRNGNISTLHIWWARRPLAACRAVICAALWPDPVDPLCPEKFKKESARLMKEFRDARGGKPRNWGDPLELRGALLDFIADFADWENGNIKIFLDTSNILTQVAHESLGGSGDRPLVVDPFAGGGAIPLEALRVGADVFASDLNPIPILLNRVLLEYIPKHGARIADALRKYSNQITKLVEKKLSTYYPLEEDGSRPIAYLWARTIISEAPSGENYIVEVPMLPSMFLAKKSKPIVALRWCRNSKGDVVCEKNTRTSPDGKSYIVHTPKLEIFNPSSIKDVETGTVARGAVVCPVTNFTTPITSVRRQLSARGGGSNDARLIAVVISSTKTRGKTYREPRNSDIEVFLKAKKEAVKTRSVVAPTGELPFMSGVFNVPLYGISSWDKHFNDRQKLAIETIFSCIKEIPISDEDIKLDRQIRTLLSLAFSGSLHYLTSTSTWFEGMLSCFIQGQALPMKWDYAELNPLTTEYVGTFSYSIDRILSLIEDGCIRAGSGDVTIQQSDARHVPLPDDSVDAVVTDPPYYYSIPYADLSEFFYGWLKQVLGKYDAELFRDKEAPKVDEICEMARWDSKRYPHKTALYFEQGIQQALTKAREYCRPSAIGVVVFAHKDTEAWEKLLNGLLQAGWIITASWPIDTERQARMRANNAAALASSVHLVCRPREYADGSVRGDKVGDWRDVLAELPRRIHNWMPRLSEAGVVGADAIFSCLGPALEIYSEYSRVEKANGEKVELREYLEQVWSSVAKEALNMIFQGAHTEGFEEDARITAMWLWTLSTGSNDEVDADFEDKDDTGAESSGTIKTSGFSLEFDAARKIAQGLGVHLENLSSVVEIDGDQARLLSVAERVNILFGKGSVIATPGKKKKKENQITLFEEFNKVEEQGWSLGDEKSSIGKTILDRLHQAMILFGAGRGDALKRFLVDEGIGKDERFWCLAQSLSALYPSNVDEKRWVDGVLARKKSLGF